MSTYWYLRARPVMGATIKSTLLALAGWAAAGTVAAQTISDVPPAVKNNVAPNLMFMIDNSGSMINIVPSAPYNPAATYLSSCSGSALVPAGTAVELVLTSSGEPRFTYGGNTYRHSSLPSGQRCFSNTSIYGGTLITNSSFLDADYTGHYLNWYFGNYDGHPITGWTDRKRVLTGAVETRIEIAKTSAKAVIDGLPLPPSVGAAAPLRVGLSTYRNNSTGGRLMLSVDDLTASRVPTLKTSIDTLTPTGNTPLASTLADIGRYFATGPNSSVNVTTANAASVDLDALLRLDGTDAGGSGGGSARNACLENAPSCTNGSSARPIQQWCQRSSVFMMTDGRPQADRVFNNNTHIRDYDRDCATNPGSCTGGASGTVANWDRKTARTYESRGSDYLDDVAKALFDIDLRPDLQPPPLPVGAPPRNPPKKNNLRTYTIGFADLQVVNDPLLTNTAAQGGGLFLQAQDGPSLTQAFRDALVDAFAKDAAAAAVSVVNAQITVNNVGYSSSYNSGTWYGDLEAVSLDTTTGLPVGAAAWSLRTNLNAMAASSRKIVSFNGSTGAAFTAGNFTGSGSPTALTAGVINWVRGDRTGEGSTYRQRTAVLGDIINAEATVVNYATGESIIFQPANDGMVHVIDGRIDASVPTRGQELWAYVPRMIHGKLTTLSSRTSFNHQYLVDATATATQITGAGPMGRILVGGLGKGGAGFYALDITSYEAANETIAAQKVKWEFSDSGRMGYSFGRPLIVKTADTSIADGWRVVVASGYDNGVADGRGYVWVLNPIDGSVIRRIDTGAGGAGAAAAGLAHLGKMANAAPDAVVRYVYGGDLLGNVWRFDLDVGTATRIAVLTDGSGATQPVTTAPSVGPATAAGRFFVYVGTGRYFSDEDIAGNPGANRYATQMQSMYGIIDDTTAATTTLPNIRGTNGASCPATPPGGSGDFVCQAITAHVPANGTFDSTAYPIGTKRGFYADLPVANSRISADSALTTGGTLAFTVNLPTNVACDPGGSSYFFTLSGSNGGAIPNGTNFYSAGKFLSNALASRPVIIITASDTRGLIKHSDRSNSSEIIPCSSNCSSGNPPAGLSPAPAWKRIYWRSLN